MRLSRYLYGDLVLLEWYAKGEGIGSARRLVLTIEALLGTHHYRMEKMNLILRQGDCVEVLKSMEENTVGSVLCDPPYG